ncbi:MAG: UDP-N-acetylenolpyruvoylglucosamine reductase [Chromatiales bacterium]|jgi:UDP-N-acetylmuramate dehydrogenase|nr:UDP-N-acetylenolpyruvoylglucosamine reductase [Chromatiales bacterium]MDP6151099.1 UDP-N-acetylmuramate dehydrogenase [Gammaproteobacteria bacterium]MDP7094277.1 UDP-N-acetylmuramate dehydrogenase [Gammaproteobacteria bacterium]MDP7269761.1 UDP-N-acetylmuramate dehydrogenase [Gammaproteobacteria bacterium]HJP04780.1 UDP-N-acetylmuramate dehydrogenase [Gammaproteobacteria bacterium]
MAAIDNERFSDQMRFNESMARHTSWRTGGNADTWFRPATREDLIAFMQTVEPGTPLHWVGLGSNLLVRDGGIRGVVIVVQDALAAVEDIDKQRVSAGSGVACTVFARHCVRRGLGPAEFFAGIPGTIGGALAMNAGAFGGETWNQVESVDVIDQEGKVHTREPAEYTIAYRQVDGPANEWFLGAHFVFTENYDTSMDKVKALVNERREKQPLGLPSCGSVFRNPPADHAARLIEATGLKGFSIGGAVVSEKHANFIINRDNASAADIEMLIEHIQGEVKAKHGVELVREVHIIGERTG